MNFKELVELLNERDNVMNKDIQAYNDSQSPLEREICVFLATEIEQILQTKESKIWHAHPVWFIEGNPIVGYSKIKAGIRLMFWSGADFEEMQLKPGSGKFMDASILYNDTNQIVIADLRRWLEKSKDLQWDYKNIRKREGFLERVR